ncbi:hypothetical protein B6N60_02865 [Richelia sinica FACHB-800]|uniref:Uncharacterized protein n=1 Tax=Richelia sinica FACHB-800 TaxID=1357546 RepID=A0A975TA37_9NOST|nr:hypothetical protein B6N60_02865 [Richelia sinica FACHB-800]
MQKDYTLSQYLSSQILVLLIENMNLSHAKVQRKKR